MTIAQTHIGVDIAKHWIDTHSLETGTRRRIETSKPALRDFARRAAQAQALVVLEASGCYERALLAALDAAGASWVRVNPRQARDFAHDFVLATGRLAKTDRVDAAVLAEMGAGLAAAPRRRARPRPGSARAADTPA